MPLRNFPIKRKITVVILVTCFTALVAMGLALLTYEIHSYRQSTSRAISAMAGIIALNTAPGLHFDDKKDVQQVLNGLRADPSIIAAAVYNQNGTLFATYPASMSLESFPRTPGSDGLAFGSRSLSSFSAAMQGDQRVGTLFLEADLSDMYNRLGIYGLVILAVLISSSFLAYLVSTVLQRQISVPLVNLASTAKLISEKRDYSVRAAKSGNDEIGDLTAAFNLMLERIEAAATERRAAMLDLERARDAAEQASRAKDDFVAALSHELRTPLNPVLLLASDAASNQDLPAAIRADFETIRKNVELEARLIDDLLDLTRITRGKLTLEKRPVDIAPVLRDAIDNVRAEVDEKHIQLSVVFGKRLQLVVGDAVRLQQIFWNVLRNAVKFTPIGGSVSVVTSVNAAGDRVKVEVSDTGIGLTQSELSTIFESFVQGEQAHRFGGMGLGLAISRMLVDLHSGSIVASSRGRDRGAKFTIELPLVAGATEPPAATPATTKTPNAEKSAGGRRILLVDDHEPTRMALTQLLKVRKYHVRSAGSLEEAKQLAETETFDILVSDIGLPDGSGYDLMAELHARRGLKGIALSGYGMEQDIAKSRQAGFVSHLIKPVTVKSLEKALAAVEQPQTLNV